MRILDYFYTNLPKLENFFPRKVDLPIKESFVLFGSRGCGKSALIIDYLNQLEHNFLYIDAQDPAFILEELDLETLNSYIQEEKITTVAIDHYYEGFLDSLPNTQQVIVISRKPLSIELQHIQLLPLDFEEFINFKSSLKLPNNFDLYSRFGSLPQVAHSVAPAIACRNIFFEKYDAQEGKVLMIISLFHGKVATPHQIYQRARDYFKISKDWLYKAIKEFLKEGVLYQIETFDKSIGKKLFLHDFIFSRYLNKEQTFLTTFDSIITLAFIKHNISVKSLQNPLAYITNSGELIVVAPFESEEQFWVKAQKNFALYKKLKPSNVTILTINSSYQFDIQDIKFQALPFYEWVTGL